MPKSTKKRKNKAADFAKAKLKLGKGKQPASNLADISFKSRSITLPTQSITRAKDTDVPATKRRLTFDDLIAHTKHYSASIRKDAILGLRELLDTHWEILDSSLTILMNVCARAIGDEDASVRKAVLAFFTWLLPRIPHEDIVPHSQLLLLFTTSAQTNIFPEIRIDAIRFLNIFLEYIPRAVIAGWNEDNDGHGARILEGYLGMLDAGTKFGKIDGSLQATSSVSITLKPPSKLIVLQSLSTFLHISLSSVTATSSNRRVGMPISMHTRYMESVFPTITAYRSFEGLLLPFDQLTTHDLTWEEIDLNNSDGDFSYSNLTQGVTHDPQWSLSDLVEGFHAIGSADTNSHDSADVTLVATLARTLYPVLIATFLDCAPTVFSPSEDLVETEVWLVVTIGQIVRILYGFILQTSVTGSHDHAIEAVSDILNHMTPYFPFSSVNRNIKFDQAFQDLNLIFCELVSLLLLTAHSESSYYSHRNKLRQTNRKISGMKGFQDSWKIQSFRVGDYIIQLLRGEAVALSQLGKPLTYGVYIALLPSIWALLSNEKSDLQEMSVAVLQATIDHSLKTSSKSAVKSATIEFVARLALLQSEPLYQGNFRIGRNIQEDQKLQEWIAHLPQTLWEFGANNLPASELILRFLLRILQREMRFTLSSKTIEFLRLKLAPYFSIDHPVRGQLLGPYSKLPNISPIRRLSLDVVFNLMSIEVRHNDGLCASVDLAVSNTEERCYWAHLQRHMPN